MQIAQYLNVCSAIFPSSEQVELMSFDQWYLYLLHSMHIPCTCQPTSEPASQPVSQAVSQAVNQPVSQAVNQAVNQPWIFRANRRHFFRQSVQSVRLDWFLNFSLSLPSLFVWVIAWPHSARGGTVCSSGGKSPSGGSRPGAPSPRAGLRAAPSGARPRNDFPSPSRPP